MKKTLLPFALISPLLAEFRIDPTLHINGVIGSTSASSYEEIGGHAHDPNNDFALQGIDLGFNFHVDDWLSGFINANVFTDEHHDFDIESEEAFFKLQELPGGFEIRGGRFLNRLGTQNNVHLHAWNHINADLFTSQFLGEEGLTTEGFELTWLKDFDASFLALSASHGKAVNHEHEEEALPGAPHEHGAEGAFFSDDLTTARALIGYNHTDFHQHRIGFNGAWGDNEFGRNTDLYSFDYTYTWRENGIEAGGREVMLGLEAAYRDAQWRQEDDPTEIGAVSQATFAAFARYHFSENWITALRYEHLQGRKDGEEIHMGVTEYAFNSEERDRISLALTRKFDLGDHDSFLRLQYSHDDLPGESADSIFLQFGFNFGPGEVR